MKKQILFYLMIVLWLQSNAQQISNVEEGKWKGPQALSALAAAPVALIPFPQKVEWSGKKYLLKGTTTIAYSEANADEVKNAVCSLQQILSDYGIKSVLKAVKPNSLVPKDLILLQIDKKLETKSEGYSIEVSPAGMVLTGKDASGVFYAVQTLHQMLLEKNNSIYVPGCKMVDWPAFALRGFMHDTGRNFQEIAALKSQIDRLASYKFNTFHWHLTDNPAWRPQSKIYPQLNEIKNRKPGRDPEKSYSFDDIRDLISYAKQRCVRIIPELDMPGHSAFFKPTFGFKMETEEGMQVLEKLIDEFCAEISADDCPIIHLGSDEVHIPNPKEFIRRMTDRLKLNGRKAMVWNPGLKTENSIIEQLWHDEGAKNASRMLNTPYVDSYAGYLNSSDALSLIQRYFFQQICNRAQGDSLAMGGILCCWPDTRVDDKQKILLYNPVWPGAITYSEAVWCGRPQYGGEYMSVLPPVKTEAGKYFQEFEQRLANHRDRFFKSDPFPFVQFSQVKWHMSNPYLRAKDQPADVAFDPEKTSGVSPEDHVKTKLVTGGVLRFNALINPSLLSPDANETVYITTNIFVPESRQIHAWIGFETAARSNRRSAGIPSLGKWDANGGTVWVNNKELEAPAWEHPGANRYLNPTWETPANEIPYSDEEFYWSRKPVAIQLNKGWNRILMRVPRTYKDQAWMSVFIPVKRANERWVEDLSLRFK